MRQNRVFRKFILLFILVAGSLSITSCDMLFSTDGRSSSGIDSGGGFYYFADNGNFSILMLDKNLKIIKSWSTEHILKAGTRVQGITFDGDYLWISAASSTDQILQLDTSTDSLMVLNTFNAPPDKHGTVRGIAWDGTFLWALNSGSVSFAIAPALYKLDPSDGHIIDEYALPDAEPRALTYVGNNGDAYARGADAGLYYSDVKEDVVYKFITDKFIFSQAFPAPVPPRGAFYVYPVGLTFNGHDFWVVNSSSYGDHLIKLNYKGSEQELLELPYKTPGPLVWAEKDVSKAPPLSVTGVSPNSGARGASLQIEIKGRNFKPGSGLSVSFGEGILVTEAHFTDLTTISAEITIAADARTGKRDVTVTNPDGQTAVGDSLFTVTIQDPTQGYIWFADGNSDILYKMKIADTTIVQQWNLLTVAPGGSPQGLAFDGTDIWLCAAGSDDKIMKIDVSAASLTSSESFTAPPSAAGTAREIAFDDQGFLWVANSTENSIYKMNQTNGTILETITTPGSEVRGITFANGRLYCNDRTLDKVYVYDFDSKSWSAVFDIPVPPNGTTSNRYSTGMTWDGINFWIANSTYEFDYLFQITLEGNVLRTYEFPNRGAAQVTALMYTQK